MSMNNGDFKNIFEKAQELGMEAGNKCLPQPMTVVNSITKEQFHVPNGICGFANVNIKPATSSFCKWLKKEGYVKDVSYDGGYDIYVHAHGQSYEKKSAHAHAMAKYLNEAGLGVKARGMCWID